MNIRDQFTFLGSAFKRSSRQSSLYGLPSGTLVAPEDSIESTIELLEYDAEKFIGPRVISVDELPEPNADKVQWVNVYGLANVELLKKIGLKYKVHTLILEDVLDVEHRPKAEELDDQLFVVLKMWEWNDDDQSLSTEQISFILFDNLILSFQERTGDVLDTVRHRIRESMGRIRRKSADYLLYALMDVIVDQAFLVVDKLSHMHYTLERSVLRNAEPEQLQEILQFRVQVNRFQHSTLALRELINKIELSDDSLIKPDTKRFFTDVQDHILALSDALSGLKESVGALENSYYALLNLQLNRVVKVLTVMSTVFIPLSFIAGVYGMNFNYMPELSIRKGYFLVLGVMLLIALLILFWFKKKKWL